MNVNLDEIIPVFVTFIYILNLTECHKRKKTVPCPWPQCALLFGSKRALTRHFMALPTHKLRGRAKPAGEVVTEFRNCEEVNKSARVKQLMKELLSDFMCENILPVMAKNITLYEFLLQRCCTDLTEKENTRQTKMCKELTDMLNTIKEKNPEVYNYILPTKTKISKTGLVQIDPNVFNSVSIFPQPNAITGLVQISPNDFNTPSRFPQPNATFSCGPKLKTF